MLAHLRAGSKAGSCLTIPSPVLCLPPPQTHQIFVSEPRWRGGLFCSLAPVYSIVYSLAVRLQFENCHGARPTFLWLYKAGQRLGY